jgi:Ca-activated chloride channel family protein
MSTSAAGGSTYSTGTATGGRGGSTAAATTGPTGTAGAGGAAGSPVGGSPSGGTTATTTTAVPPVAVNPFVMTAHDPFSTFGADVDTASYDVFRQYAQLNKLPPRAGVRTEEYVNYFSYAYPGPGVDGPHPFMISLAAASNVFDRNTTLLRVGIQATKPPAYTKKPTNLVFLLDVSGSMEDPKKLGLIKTMMVDALDNLLDPTDTVSVVTYSTTATVRLPPTSVAKRDTIVTVISGLSAGGSTAGADGIGYAYQQATAGFIEGGINHIVMCTDGDFNVGVSSTADLLTLIKQKRSTGITLTALGFGMGNLNDSMMEAISDAGNGIYSVISDEDHAKTYVRTKMLSTLIHVAKDMKIQVEFSPTQVYAYRLLGYEDRDIADSNFRNDAVDGGEVGAGHRVTALYELVLAGNKIPSFTGMPTPDDGAASTLPAEILPGDAVLVKVRYKDVDATDATQAKEVSTGLAATALTTTLEVADQDLRWAVAVAGLAEILKGSPYASKAFLPLIRNIVASQASRDADRTEFAALLDKIVPLL